MRIKKMEIREIIFFHTKHRQRKKINTHKNVNIRNINTQIHTENTNRSTNRKREHTRKRKKNRNTNRENRKLKHAIGSSIEISPMHQSRIRVATTTTTK